MIMETKEKALETIIDEMVDVVENSKDEIFHISEEARSEHEQLKKELKDTREKVHLHNEYGDQLEGKVKFSRQQLAKVSKHFDRYKENEIREVYEQTHDLQTKLAMLRHKEKILREKRDDLENRLIDLEQLIIRAQGLANKISVVLNYLNDDIRSVNDFLEEAKEKHEFGLKIIQAQEEERKKISREIHDGPAQMLANILLRSELVDRTFREGSKEDGMAEIKSLREMVRTSLYEVRRIIYDLRPMALDDLGLLPTIKRYVKTISEYSQIDIQFTSTGEDRRLNQNYEVAFFRLIQEGVQNAIKHAEASKIHVNLEVGKEYLTMVVKDNGVGFDPKEKPNHSFGLIGMRERVEMFDGKMTIDTAPGKGTRIMIQVPYHLN